MKIHLFSKRTSTKKEHDMIIGQALARAIRETSRDEECPPLEDIAALIDGKLDTVKKDRLMEHLAHCDKCYETFSMSYELIKEEKKKSWSFVPYAIAASILIISGYFIYSNYLTQGNQIQIAQDKTKVETETPPDRPVVSQPDVKPKEKEKKESPVLIAMVELNSEAKELIINTKDNTIRDEKFVNDIVKALKIESKDFRQSKIEEVRIEWPDTKVKSLFLIPDKAEVELKNGVLTIKILE